LIALGAPAERVHYIPTGVVLPTAPVPRAVSGAAPHLIAIGRLTAKKGFAVALETLRLLQAPLPGTRLMLIGDGPQRAALHAQARRDGLAPYVEFCGALPHHATLAALARADLLIAPSQTAPDGDAEGAPVVLMEALAHEVPVVATDHAAIPEVVPDGIAGRLVAEGDAAALAAAVVDLWRQPALRHALGRAGREHVARQFDLTRAVAQLDALYRQVARS
jgi:glycosyltransferase involved in cell wall biosynthesis